jgi:hypothetical protein
MENAAMAIPHGGRSIARIEHGEPSPDALAFEWLFFGTEGYKPIILARFVNYESADSEARTLAKGQRPLGGIRAISGRVGGLLGQSQPVPHVLGLLLHRGSLFVHGPPLEKPESGNGKSSECGDDSAPLEPPTGRRVIFVLCGGLLLFPGCYFGGKFIDCGRRRVGFALIVGCYCVFACGLALIVLSGFPGTWGWWL